MDEWMWKERSEANDSNERGLPLGGVRVGWSLGRVAAEIS